MKVVRIFGTEEDILCSVQWHDPDSGIESGKAPDALAQIYNEWNDPQYLRDFFNEFEKDYRDNGGTDRIRNIVRDARKEGIELLQSIDELANNHNAEGLANLFKPLANEDDGNDPSKLKAYGGEYQSYMRVYAVKHNNVYYITGGAIKLTQKMQGRPHLEKELYKLNLFCEFLEVMWNLWSTTSNQNNKKTEQDKRAMATTKKTLADLKKDMPKSSFHEKMAFHRENKQWLDKSFEISLTILDAIDEKGWNQTQLAEKLGVSRQRVSKMLKGKENFQLSTLVKLEEVLGVEFVNVEGLNFKSKLNNYLADLTKALVHQTSTVKRQKFVFRDSTFANETLSRVVIKTTSKNNEDSSKFHLAA